MRKTKTKRVWSAVLSFALVVSSVTGFQAKKADAAADKETLVVYVAAEGKNADGSKTVDLPKTAVLVEDGATASDAIKQALDSSAYKGNYTISNGAYGDSLDDINGITSFQIDENDPYNWAYWSFMINGEYSNVGIGGYTVKAQDRISLIFTYDNTAVECKSFLDDISKNPGADAQKQLLENAKKQQEVLAQKIYETQFASGEKVPGIENADGLYSVFSLARAGFSADAFYDAVYEKISAQFTALNQRGSFYDADTDATYTYESIMANKAPAQYYAKIALCVAALGKNPADTGGTNLIEKLVSKSVYDASSIYSRESMILFAIDAKDSEIPTGEEYLTRVELVNKLVSDTDIQIGTAIEWNSLDSAAMAIQALAPYADTVTEDINREALQSALKKVFGYLGTMQGADGIYGDSYTPNNPWTLAQIMITMGAFGVNALSEENGYDFIKNGKTVFDAAAPFVDVTTKAVDESLMSFQPEQLLRGLNACIRVADGSERIFNTKNVAYTVKDATGKPIADGEKPAADDNKEPIVSDKVTLKKPVIQKVVSSKKKTLTVKFKKTDGAKKYVVEISKNKKFNKITKKTVKKTTAKFTKLISGKKYYVRVKAYAGEKESAYSKVVSKTVK